MAFKNRSKIRNPYLIPAIALAAIVFNIFILRTVFQDHEKLSSGSKGIALVPKKALEETAKQAQAQSPVKKQVRNMPKLSAKAQDVVKKGLARIGIPYVYGGATEKGFDCSGFVYYTFSEVGVKVPRSSELLSDAGRQVSRQEARRGDILIFTGTDPARRTPGHVGIIISKKGEPISFVHASSNGGVKVSQVEGTNYERRFLGIRRVL